MKKKKIIKSPSPFIEYLDTGIFPATVLLSFGLSPDNIVDRLHSTGNFGWARGLTYHADKLSRTWEETWGYGLKTTVENTETGETKTTFFILLKEFNFSDDHYTKLAHEVLHICQFFLPDVLDRDIEHEAEAYLHTHLMKQVLQHIRANQ